MSSFALEIRLQQQIYFWGETALFAIRAACCHEGIYQNTALSMTTETKPKLSPVPPLPMSRVAVSASFRPDTPQDQKTPGPSRDGGIAFVSVTPNSANGAVNPVQLRLVKRHVMLDYYRKQPKQHVKTRTSPSRPKTFKRQTGRLSRPKSSKQLLNLRPKPGDLKHPKSSLILNKSVWCQMFLLRFWAGTNCRLIYHSRRPSLKKLRAKEPPVSMICWVPFKKIHLWPSLSMPTPRRTSCSFIVSNLHLHAISARVQMDTSQRTERITDWNGYRHEWVRQ